MLLPQDQQATPNVCCEEISANILAHEDIHTKKEQLKSYHQERIVSYRPCLYCAMLVTNARPLRPLESLSESCARKETVPTQRPGKALPEARGFSKRSSPETRQP